MTDTGAESGESDPPSTATEPVESTPESTVDLALDERQTLHPRVRYQWVISSSLGAVFTSFFVGFIAFAVSAAPIGVGPFPIASIVASVFVLLVVAAVVRSVYRYRSWAYVVRTESLYLERGVVTQVKTVVPFVRVQHIDTRRSAIERLLGLSSLVVYTAGSRGADVSIPGLTPDRAAQLQERLKRLAIDSEEEDAV